MRLLAARKDESRRLRSVIKMIAITTTQPNAYGNRYPVK